MRIFILTYSWAKNYGAILQAFALQTAMRSMGGDAFVLPIIADDDKSFVKRWIGRSIAGTIRKVRANLMARKFDSFKVRHFKSGGVRPATSNVFNKKLPEADVFVVGSDQVWNLRANHDADCRNLFFLGNCSRGKKCAYAASWGLRTLSDDEYSWARRCLQKFSVLSVREKSGLSILNGMGLQGWWLPDPTLLMLSSDWRRCLRLGLSRRNRLFLYKLGWSTVCDLDSAAREVGKKIGASIVAPYPGGNSLLSPDEWVACLSCSRFVITNSFHGTVFSIIFHVPFVVVPLSGEFESMNERIVSLLEKSGLPNRMAKTLEEICCLADSEIDWTAVDGRIRTWREEGLDFLRMNVIG